MQSEASGEQGSALLFLFKLNVDRDLLKMSHYVLKSQGFREKKDSRKMSQTRHCLPKRGLTRQIFKTAGETHYLAGHCQG
jgi:hypothetical protein